MMRSQWLLVQASWGCISEHNSQALEVFGGSLGGSLGGGFSLLPLVLGYQGCVYVSPKLHVVSSRCVGFLFRSEI